MANFGTFWKRALLVLLGWLSVSLFFAAVRSLSSFAAQRPFWYFFYVNAALYIFWAVAFPLVAKSVRIFPLDEGSRLRHSIALFLIATALAMVISISYLAVMYRTIVSADSLPAFPTLGTFLKQTQYRLIQFNLLFGMVLILALQGWRIWQDFQSERVRSIELERQLAVSRLETLRMQLHPHFLFNTLQSIASLVTAEPATARKAVVALGDFLRRTLEGGAPALRSFAAELEFADLYMGIEKLRLGDRVVLHYEIDPEAIKAEVPSLLLQPLFENAIRHGAARMVSPCEIRLHAQRTDNMLNISVENDGPVEPECTTPPQFGVGLRSTMARLRLHYGNDFTLEYYRRPQGGVRIVISLPYRKPGDATEMYVTATSQDSHASR